MSGYNGYLALKYNENTPARDYADAKCKEPSVKKCGHCDNETSYWNGVALPYCKECYDLFDDQADREYSGRGY